jgi:hypothetical protein
MEILNREYKGVSTQWRRLIAVILDSYKHHKNGLGFSVYVYHCRTNEIFRTMAV